jgi:hypothetical protein
VRVCQLPALAAGVGHTHAPLAQALTHVAAVPAARHTPGKLLTLLQQGKRMVQEGALTALASVADCSQEEFVRYYDTVMPLLSNILHNAQAKEHR